MVNAMPLEAAEELDRALRSALAAPEPTPVARRELSLGPLAAMVVAELERRDPDDGRPPRIPRRDYDRASPEGAPTSHVLVRKYGSWVEACRAAHALPDKGRVPGGSKPWQTPSLGRRRNRDYTPEEVFEAVIEVARRLGKAPGELSSHTYYAYVAEIRRRARQAGADPPRWPTQRSVERFFAVWEDVRRSASHC
jgi:hypothetical protein